MAQMTDYRLLGRNPKDRPSQAQGAILLDKRQWAYVQHLHNLTPRELEIAELLCRGLENGRVAQRLRISPGTVKTHVRNIYRKVGVSSRIAMLLKFVSDARNGG